MLGVIRGAKPKLLVLEAGGIIEIDFTAAQTLLELIKTCRAEGVTIAIARLESVRAREAFERFKLYDVLPRDQVFLSVDAAVSQASGEEANPGG